MPSEIVQVSVYEEPEDLLSALRGSNDDFWDEIPHVWLFRGHADADWELLPSVLRKDSKLTHHPEKPPGPYATMLDQVDVEASQVLRFADIANQQGLAIPGGWNTARRLLSGACSSETMFPPFELWDLFALAQHHGVPTRLLDWSHKPLTAAYFAAHGATQMLNEKKLRESQCLGVWALNTTAVWRNPPAKEAVYVVDPPRHGNLNLIAQDGVFTVHTDAWASQAPPQCEPFDSTVARLYPDPARHIGRAKMRLLTLPARKARKLLVRLEAEGISASALFPGYDGVVRSLSEEITHNQLAWRAPASED